MDLTANDLARIAWAQTWQLSVLIAAVATTARYLCRNRPHLAHALWLVVLVKCVTPPVWSSPCGVFCWTQPVAANPPAVTEPPAAPERPAPVATPIVKWTPLTNVEPFANTPTSIDVVPRTRPTVVDANVAQVGAIAVPEVIESLDVSTTSAGSTGTRGSLSFWIIIWLCGTALIALNAVVRLALCLRAAKRAGWRRDTELEALAAELAQTLNLKRAVRVFVTNGRLGPAVVGLFRPLILLPEVVVRGRTSDDLKPILMHELVHIRRGDLWVGLLQVVASALWWFHPLVWLSGRLVSREAERCCDEESIAALGGDPARYAYSLLDVLDLKHTLKPVPAFPGVRPVEVTSKRLERIMSLRQGCHKRTPWWCRLCTAALAVAVLPGAALIVSANGEPADSVPPDAYQAVAAESATPKANKWSPMTVTTYPVGDLLRKLMLQRGLNETAARQLVKQSVMSSCHGLWDETPGVDRKRGDVASIRWFLTDLIVRQKPVEHRSIRRMLDAMRNFGFEQASFKIRIFTNPPADLKTRWTVPRTDIPGDENSENRLRDAHQLPTLAPLERPFPGTAVIPRSRARMSVETNLTPLQEIMDKARTAEVVAGIQRHAKSNMMSAPAVTIFNGRTAAIQQTVQRPYVVGISEGKPQIRIVSEGLRLRLRPVSRKGGSIWLDYEVTLSEVRDVKTTTVQVVNRKQPITLQNPTVATTRLDSSVVIPLGKTLLIGGLTNTNRNGKTETIWLMIEPSEFKLRSPSPVAKPNGAAQATRREPQQPRDMAKPAMSARAKANLERSKLQPFEAKTISQAMAVGRILALGGEVVAGEGRGDRVVAVHMRGKRYRDADLDQISVFPGPVVLLLSGTSVTDAGLARCVPKLHLGWLVVRDANDANDDDERLAGSPHIFDKQTCLLSGTGPLTTIAALKNVGRASQVKTLVLQESDAGDAVLKQIATLKQLERLALDLTRAKSAELKLLAGLPKLRELYLTGPNLSDNTLLQLTELKQLRKLELNHGCVSKVALQALRHLMPKCQVSVSQAPKAPRQTVSPYATKAPTVATTAGFDRAEPSRYKKAPSAETKAKTWKEIAASRRKTKVRQANATADKKTLIVKTYAVADLVVPIPGHAQFRTAVDQRKPRADGAPIPPKPVVDMKPLIQFITTQIAPKSWSDIDGPGSIAGYQKTLSLVIRQTEDVHEQVGELLTQLRRLQDVQVTLSVRMIEVSATDVLCRQLKRKLKVSGVRRSSAVLTAADARTLAKPNEKSNRFTTLQDIKLTLFRGQGAEISSGPIVNGKPSKDSRKLQLGTRVSDDRRTVHVQVALDAANALEALAKGTAADVPDGGTVLIDVDDLTASDAIPAQSFTRGDVERVVGGQPQRNGKKRFLIVSPRIIVQEEEEEVLGIPLPAAARR